jgi:hypothetical protein
VKIIIPEHCDKFFKGGLSWDMSLVDIKNLYNNENPRYDNFDDAENYTFIIDNVSMITYSFKKEELDSISFGEREPKSSCLYENISKSLMDNFPYKDVTKRIQSCIPELEVCLEVKIDKAQQVIVNKEADNSWAINISKREGFLSRLFKGE